MKIRAIAAVLAGGLVWMFSFPSLVGLSMLLLANFAYKHFWAEWDQFPAWYNVLVVVLAVPAVIFGGRIPELAGRHRKPGEPGAVG